MSARASLLTGLAALALVASAHAQSQYRIYAESYAYYYNNVSTTSPLFGLDPQGNPNVVYGTVSYGYDYKSGAAYDQITARPKFIAGGTWDGDASIGMTTVTTQAYATTGWGTNHASASVSGFTPVSQTYDGQFTYPGGSAPQHVETSNYVYSTGHSTWEELYQIGGGTGTGVFSGSIHIDGALGPRGTSSVGSSSMSWALTTFSGDTVAALNASYDTASDTWYKAVYSAGQWIYSDGAGALSIDEDVTGSYSFTYGAALYLKSDLYTTVTSNGSSDFSNTVQFTGMKLPEGSLVYVLSGAEAADYGISFTGDGSGTICASLACTVAGTAPIPEPGSYALLLAGLGVVGFTVARRRR